MMKKIMIAVVAFELKTHALDAGHAVACSFPTARFRLGRRVADESFLLRSGTKNPVPRLSQHSLLSG
jgi:hypothetical protein